MSIALNTIQLRPMVLTDMSDLMRLKNAEHWNQTEDDWAFLINQNQNYCLVACHEELIVGSVTAMKYGNNLSWIGMMLVDKEFRGQGISKLLLNSIIEKSQDCNSIKLDATTAGIPVYDKLGFTAEYEICRMTTPELSFGKHVQFENADYEIQTINDSNIHEVSELDQRFYGVNRAKLFQFLLNQQNDNCWCLKHDNSLTGYVFCRKGSQYIQIGPLLAKSAAEAKILLNKVFQNLSGKPILVDILKQQNELVDWLVSIGFVEQRSFMRMYLKNNSSADRLENQFLIAGPELS